MSKNLFHPATLLMVLLHLALLANGASAIPEVDFQQGSIVNIDSNAQLLSPEIQTMDPDDILRIYMDRDDAWLPHAELGPGSVFGPGYQWQRLQVRNPNDFPLNLYLRHHDPNLIQGNFLIIREDGVVERHALGTNRPFAERPIKHRRFLVPFVLEPGESVVLVAGHHTGSTIQRTDVIEWSTFWGKTETAVIGDGMYFGATVLATLLVLLLFAIARDRLYLYCWFLIAGNLIYVVVREGYGYQYLWPNWSGAQDELIMVVLNLGTIGAILFTRRFLQLSPDNGAWLYHLSNLYLGWCLVLTAVTPFAPREVVIHGLGFNMFIMLLYYFLVWSYSVWRGAAGDQLALIYAFAWLAFFVPKGVSTIWIVMNPSAHEPIWALARNGELLFAIVLCGTLLADFRRKYVRNQVRQAETEARGRFLTGVSHELRTPLNGVLGSAELLAETDLSPTQRHYSEIISNSGNVLLNLINDTLDLARYNEQEIVLERVPFHLDRLIAECSATFLPQVDRKKVPLYLDTGPEVPLRVFGDEFRLRQVLFNLLSNAIKFTHKGMVSLRVSAELKGSRPAMVTFVVKDTGIGIPQSALDKIFDPFSQAEASTTREYGGSGLGLAICRAIGLHMGGTIEVKSEVGSGSTFTICIPMEVDWSEEQKRLTRLRKLQGKKLLLLSDFDGMYDAILPNLSAWGVDYECVADIGTARAQLARQSFDGLLAYFSQPTPDALDDIRRLGLNTVLVHHSSLPVAPEQWSQKLVDLPVPAGLQDIADTIMEVVQASCDESVAAESSRHSALNGDDAAVLVVEDNAVNQMVTVGMLEYLGLKTDVAENGQEACELAARRHYDLILMDCSMPVMDGYSASRRILALGQEPPPVIVALTADAQEGNRERCAEAGMNMVLHKPLSISELSDCLSYLRESLAGESQLPG